MKSAPIPDNDAERLRALDEYAILDTPLEPAFDALTELAAEIVGVPIALVSIVDAQRQWFKSRYGLDAPWTPRDVSFCGHVVAAEVSLVVEDAHQDARFSDNPLVLGAPHVRFYAGVPLRTPDGFVLGTLCTIGHEARQITPHQERLLNHLAGQVVAQLELRRNALRLGVERQALADHLALFHLSPDLMCTWQSSQFRMLNPAWERVLGWKVSELAGQPVTALVHPDDLARTSDQLERLERGEALTPDFENRYRHADGRWVSLAWSVARRGVTCFAVARDITERVAATAALAAERVFLEMALSHLPGMSLVVFGHDLRIERAFGLDQILPEEGGQDLRGQPLDALASPENRALLVGAATRCLAGERSHRELSGRGRRLELAFVPWAERNVKLGMLLVSDITERHAMREQLSRQERLVTIGTLAAGVGHEINNPLAYVVTNIDLVVQDLASFAGGSPSARMRDILEALAEARQGAHRIAKIVRGLRAFAREDGPAAPIDVHAAIEISRNMAMHELRQKATFITELGEVPPVIGDEARLSQVLVNLFVNAAQAFVGSDVARNQIRVATRLVEDGRVSIEVEDNGPGIRAEVVPRIFDPFFTTKAVGQGTGLGLSICHDVVTGMGGTLTCETKIGLGTTFRVLLPPAASSASVLGVLSAEPSQSGPRGRILIVDDDPIVLRSMVRVLGRDHAVVAHVDSRDALVQLTTPGEHFDLIVCDMMMPAMTGKELYQRVRAVRPELAERFVFVSGGFGLEEIRAFLEEVVNERIDKPFTTDQLRDVARRMVSR